MMKIKSLLLLGISVLAFTSCSSGSDENDETTDKVKTKITFVAGVPNVQKGTRTSFDVENGENGTLTYTPLWSVGERLSVLYDINKAAIYAGTNDVLVNSTQFEYIGSNNPINTGNTIVAINKELVLGNGGTVSRGIDIGDGEGLMEDSFVDGVITTSFKSEQLIDTNNKIDEKSEILVSKPVKLEPTTIYPVHLNFKRLNGIIRVNVIAKGDTAYPLDGVGIKEIQITTDNISDDFGGDVTISVNDGVLTKLNPRRVSVKSSTDSNIGSVGANTPVYISVLPTSINIGNNFKIYFLTADGRTYERILNASDKTGNVIVPEGKVTTFNVAFGDENLKVINNPSTSRK